MPLTSSVTVFSAAIARPGADNTAASTRAEIVRFIARSSRRWSISRPEQHRGEVVEGYDRQYQYRRRPQHRLDAPPRQRPRAASVGARRFRLAIDEVVADAEAPGGDSDEDRLIGRERRQIGDPGAADAEHEQRERQDAAGRGGERAENATGRGQSCLAGRSRNVAPARSRDAARLRGVTIHSVLFPIEWNHSTS